MKSSRRNSQYLKIKTKELKKKISDLGYSQQMFAVKCGFSRQSLSSWLNRKRDARMSNVEKVAEFLQCPVTDIAEIKKWTI